jgi:anti-sigma B factor antagonist
VTLNDFHAEYLALDQQGEVTVARFTVPRLTEDVNLEQLGHELFTLVDQFDCRKLVVRLDSVEYVTSSGLGKLIALHRKMHRKKGNVVFSEPQPAVTDILKTSKLNTFFQIADSLPTAVEAALA